MRAPGRRTGQARRSVRIRASESQEARFFASRLSLMRVTRCTAVDPQILRARAALLGEHALEHLDGVLPAGHCDAGDAHGFDGVVVAIRIEAVADEEHIVE